MSKKRLKLAAATVHARICSVKTHYMLFLLFHVYPVYDSFLTLYTSGCYVLQGGNCRVDSVGTRVDIVGWIL